MNSKFNIGTVEIDKKGQGSSGNVSSKRYLLNEYDEDSTNQPWNQDMKLKFDDYSEKDELLASLDHIPDVIKDKGTVRMPVSKVKHI